MAFSDTVKLEVKKKAAFRCCRCQAIGIQIHHIIPQAQGGDDTLNNAAPLCAKCHSDYGGNPEKRKEITEMRDWWYEKCQHESIPYKKFESIERKIDKLLETSRISNSIMNELKSHAKEYIDEYLKDLDSTNTQELISNIVNIKKPFHGGSPCEMSGQQCPAKGCNGIVDVSPNPFEEGVLCNKCGLFIPAPPIKTG